MSLGNDSSCATSVTEKSLECPVIPFLRWPGGKRWLSPLLEKLAANIPYVRYVEPFLGGGSIYFALNPARALLADINFDLIEVYKTVRQHPHEVEAALDDLSLGEKSYYRIRARKPKTAIRRSAKFIYLNRTSFSGLYRVNALGNFNVPYGGDRNPSDLISRKSIIHAAERLSSAVLCSCDFGLTVNMSGSGDLVYCDPTYTVSHNKNGFIRYNESNFSWNDQVRLRNSAVSAAERGASVLVSNAHHRHLLKLYRGFSYLIVKRYSALAPAVVHRGQTSELLIWVSRNSPPRVEGYVWKQYTGDQKPIKDIRILTRPPLSLSMLGPWPAATARSISR